MYFPEHALHKILLRYDMDSWLLTHLRDGDSSVWRAAAPGYGDRIVRVRPRREQEDIDFELWLLSELSARKFPVSKPTATKGGAMYSELDSHIVVVSEFIPGVHATTTESTSLPVGKELDRRYCKAAGRALAVLHEHLAELERSRKITPRRLLNEELDRAARNEEMVRRSFHDASELFQGVHWAINEMRSASHAYQPIHNDYRYHNVLFSSFEITGVLDFDTACLGLPLKDVAHAMVEWSFPDKADGPWFTSMREFLDGYRSVATSIDWSGEQLIKWMKIGCLTDAACFLTTTALQGQSQPKSISYSYMYRKYLHLLKHEEAYEAVLRA